MKMQPKNLSASLMHDSFRRKRNLHEDCRQCNHWPGDNQELFFNFKQKQILFSCFCRNVDLEDIFGINSDIFNVSFAKRKEQIEVKIF